METPLVIERTTDNSCLLMMRQIDGNSEWERKPMYTAIWIATGTCTCQTDLSSYEIKAPALLFFTPFQSYNLVAEHTFSGEQVYFHGDFYCIERHRKEVACNGVLFNNVYTSPVVALDEEHGQMTANYLRLLREDLQRNATLGWQDMIIAHLKILLIIATRLKLRDEEVKLNNVEEETRPVLQQLQQLIEARFLEWHKPADYAAALHITVKSLSKLTNKYLSKTPSELITERIIQEAKRALHFTTLSVKEIATRSGFDDPFYFSRLFRKHTGVSPTVFREQVGVILME